MDMTHSRKVQINSFTSFGRQARITMIGEMAQSSRLLLPAASTAQAHSLSPSLIAKQRSSVQRTVCMAQQAPAKGDQGYQVEESETYLGYAFWMFVSSNLVMKFLFWRYPYLCKTLH